MTSNAAAGFTPADYLNFKCTTISDTDNIGGTPGRHSVSLRSALLPSEHLVEMAFAKEPMHMLVRDDHTDSRNSRTAIITLLHKV